MHDLIPKYDHVLISGDHNVNLLVDNNASRHVLSMYDNCGLQLLPLNSTHHDSLLDLLLTKDIARVLEHGQVPAPGFSHHDLIYLSYSLKSPKFKAKFVTFRNIKNINLNALIENAENLPWFEVELLDDINAKVIRFNELITYLYDQHAPLITRRVTHPPAPWLSPQIRNLMKQRDKAYSKYKRRRTTDLHELYKKLRNRVNQMIRNAKIRYGYSLGLENGRKLWSKLKVFNINNKNKTTPIAFHPDEINAYFSRFIPQQCPTSISMTLAEIFSQPRPITPLFNFQIVTEIEVRRAFQSIKSNARGCDNMSRSMLSPIFDIVLPTLTHLFNFSLSTGSFPKLWKMSIINPLPKTTSLLPTFYYQFYLKYSKKLSILK